MRNVIAGFAWLSPFVLIILWPRAPVAGLAIMMCSHALLLYPTLRPNVQWFGPVITCFETRRPELWLTIDDGPTEDTTAILTLLAARGAKASFFVRGTSARQRPDLIQSIIEAGHTVANHSDTHPSATFWCLPPASVAEEIDRCNETLSALTGAVPIWFRAPVGMKNPAVHAELPKRRMRLIGWSVRGFDTVSSDPAQVASRIVPRVSPGAIVVLHQGRASSLACIGRVIDDLQQRGYSFVIPEDTRLKTKK